MPHCITDLGQPLGTEQAEERKFWFLWHRLLDTPGQWEIYLRLCLLKLNSSFNLKHHYQSLLKMEHKEMDTFLWQALPFNQKMLLLLLLPAKTGGAPHPDLLHCNAVPIHLWMRETTHHKAKGYSGRTGWRGPIWSTRSKPSSYTSPL